MAPPSLKVSLQWQNSHWRDLGEPCCEWAQQRHEGMKNRGFVAGGTVTELNVHGGAKHYVGDSIWGVLAQEQVLKPWYWATSALGRY